MVREALGDAVPRQRKIHTRGKPRIEPVKAFIEAILQSDENAPRKQRHTAHRIWSRIREELPEVGVAESSIRRYVRERKIELKLLATCGTGERILLLLPLRHSRALRPRRAELRLEASMRSECENRVVSSRWWPRSIFFYCALEIVIPTKSEYSPEIGKGSLVRVQKRLLTGVWEGAMERSSTGHAPHAKYVGLFSLSPDIGVSFVPVHLRGRQGRE
jgi:hypothetical protein